MVQGWDYIFSRNQLLSVLTIHQQSQLHGWGCNGCVQVIELRRLLLKIVQCCTYVRVHTVQ